MKTIWGSVLQLALSIMNMKQVAIVNDKNKSMIIKY